MEMFAVAALFVGVVWVAVWGSVRHHELDNERQDESGPARGAWIQRIVRPQKEDD